MTPRFPGLYVVILPTYNRVDTLARALDSLLAQTDPEWICKVLDDGSTDKTPELMGGYAAQDKRIHYSRTPHNCGGVHMNEIGMTMATFTGTIWSRLGSDDVFLSRKMELDRIALASAGACYGPYQHYSVFRGPWANSTEWTQELNSPPQDVRAMLLRGEFSVSWANIAMRTDVLRQVRDAFGTFVDQRLRNMEDYLFNTRAARFTEFAWRARSEDGTHVIVGATSAAEVPWPYEPDAIYTVAVDSASYGASMLAWRNQDAQLTDVCRGDDHARGVLPLELPRLDPVIYVR